MADKQLKQFVFETKVLDEQNRIIEMIGSTEDFDRVGDRMFMNGVVLDNYLKNPIILPNHDYHSQAIGKSLSVTVVGSKLVFKIQFADTELGREWFYLYANKYMNASSIGFIGLEYKPNSEGGYDFTKWELLELSLVTVPCNPNAIQRAFTEGHISKALFDLINKNEESEVENMKVEEIQALIDKSVEGKIKDLNTKHAEELAAKEKEIEDLKTKLTKAQPQKGTGQNCADCAGGQCDGCCCCNCDKSSCKGCDKTPNPEKSFKKSGASISSKNAAIIKSVMDGMGEHIKSLKALIDVVEPDGDEAKDYTEEEIQKMVAANIENIIKEAK